MTNESEDVHALNFPDPLREDLHLIRAMTAAQWAAGDYMMPKSQLGIETDTGRIKVGAGRKWNATDYVNSSPPVRTLTYASTVNTEASAASIFDLTLTGNVTLANPTSGVNGQTIRWRIRQDATGSRTITLGNKFVIPSSATSPLPFSTAANAMDILAATYHAGRDKWDVVAMVPGY
jgi:hypothetical protein